MSASNLGIVFGPSLMRPRPSGATVSLSSLVDYPYQARIVETLIIFYSTVFPSESNHTGVISTVRTMALQQVEMVCHCFYWASVKNWVGCLGVEEKGFHD